jgi:hypothetical protein
LIGEERGQAMFVASSAMFVLLAMSALAVDTARWYQTHHQAQVAADAASLAAANCLATGGTGGTCTSTTDTTDAIDVAETIAADNGVTLRPSQISFSGGKVVINDGASSLSVFGGSAGIKSVTMDAGAAASFQPASVRVATSTYAQTITTTGTITTPTVSTSTSTATVPVTTTGTTTTPVTGSPLVLFAMDNNCADEGVYMQGGSETTDGGVWSNSSLFIDPGGSTYYNLTYGTGSSCSTTTEGGGGTYMSGSPQQASTDLTSWPVPYDTSADPLPACTTTYSGSGTWDIGNQPSSTPQVFCYPNGAILLTGYESYEDDTFICGSFSVQGGGIGLEAENYPTNKLLIYATGTGEAANLTNGAGVVKGDIETPNGTVGFDSGSNSFTGLLEGLDVNFSGGSSTITGDGPTTYGYVTTTGTTTTYTTTTSTNTSTTYGYTTTTGTTVTNTTTVQTTTNPATDGLVQ